MTALHVSRLGARPAVMLAHHKGRATTTEGGARPPAGSLFEVSGGVSAACRCTASPAHRFLARDLEKTIIRTILS
jgi:hypothetical protein